MLMLSRWIFAFALAASTANALPVSAQSPDSYSVPNFASGIDIFSVNLNPENHVVLYYAYETGNSYRTDYYDTVTGRRLYPDDEARLARDGDFAKKILKGLRLKRINHPARLPRDLEQSLSKNDCIWPYPYTLRLNARSGQRWMIFVKRPEPVTDNFPRRCVGARWIRLKMQYQVPPVFFYVVKGTTYVAPVDTRFLIRVSSLRKFFEGRDDLTLVDASLIAPLVAKAAKASASDQQDYIERIEKIVAKETERQMQNRSQNAGVRGESGLAGSSK
jgi:hypothetical protein